MSESLNRKMPIPWCLIIIQNLLNSIMMDRLIPVTRPTLTTRGVLWTSREGDDGRIFWVRNFQFRDFLSRKTWQVCFWVALFK